MPEDKINNVPEWRVEFHRKIKWLLIFRFLIILILFIAVILFFPESKEIRILLVLYGVVTLGYLGSLYYWDIVRKELNFKFLYSIEIFFELLVETGLVHMTGGGGSPLILLYALTILSSAFVFQLLGTVMTATAATLFYALMLYFEFTGIIPRPGTALSELILSSKETLFYMAYVQSCFLYMMAFLSGYLSQKLRMHLDKLEETKLELERVKWNTDQILQHMRSGLMTIDEDGNVVYFNNAASQILQLPINRVLERNLNEIGEERLSPLWGLITEFMRGENKWKSIEVTIRDKAGEEIPLEVSLDKLTIEGNPEGVIVLFDDITEKKHKEQLMKRMERLAALGEMSARLAHEIRNPLAAIQAGVEMMKSGQLRDKDIEPVAKLIMNESEHLTNILEEFLLFARLKELQPEKLTYELTNVYDTANEAINSVKMSMDPKKEIKFVNNLSKYLRVKCRKDHLRQIIVNLLTNSVDAIAEKGEIKIYQSDVSETMGGQEELVGIVVEDTGSGIPKEIMENIFDPFFTTKQHGNGMGLAIVQAIANQYGGYVDVQNLDGQGAKFTVYLKAEKKNWD